LQHASPLKHYRELVACGEFIQDENQLRAITALDRLWHAVLCHRKPGLVGRFMGKQPAPVRGIYLWGSVGRGKTWLMDLFYDHLPVERKQRVHFHRFMQRVHDALNAESRARDPLPRIAAGWAADFRILCLDEFFVSDIADAMLLAGLLENLFRHGVTLVATSNIPPDGLYRNGLQRAKFLPAIELLKRHTEVIELGGKTDYRLRILEQSEIFHYPLDEAADRVMTESFDRMAAECELDHDLLVNGRPFHARRRGDGIIWFDFDELCTKPRGGNDYIEIARAFNTVVLSNLPRLGEDRPDELRRFITLVDEFYDRNVKLLISAAAPIETIYTGRRLAFEFQRTRSRLTEMQSLRYLALPHLP
jgi:cell division protein ZapE